MQSTHPKSKIGILVIATGRYILFVEQLYRSIKKHFLKNHDVTVFVFTDDITRCPAGTVPLYQKHLCWPGASMKRYYMFCKYEAILSKMDYLYYIDSDMTVANEIKDDILGDLVGTLHAEEATHKPEQFPYDRNEKSLACIPVGSGKQYFCGGFNGGSSKAFLKMAKQLRNNIEKDLENGIVARNYDESHLNRYFADHPPTVTLDTTYCWIKSNPKEPHIIAIVKDHGYYRQGSTDAAVEKNPPGHIRVINYSNTKYRPHQQRLCAELAGAGISEVVSFSQEAIEKSDFWKQNIKILSMDRGGGYWLWKPYIILETMRAMDDGDILLYMDSGDGIRAEKDTLKFVDEMCRETGSFLVINNWAMKPFCKRDAFVLTNCDTQDYHNMNQLEAGIIGLVKNEKSMLLLEEWFRYCQNPMIVTDTKSTCGPDFKEFSDHRHDQAVLSLMAKKHDFKVVPMHISSEYFIYNYQKIEEKKTTPTIPAQRKKMRDDDWQAKLAEKHLPADMSETHPAFKVPSMRNKFLQCKKEFLYK